MNTRRIPKYFWQIGIVILVSVLLWLFWKALFVPQETIIVEEKAGKMFPTFSLAQVGEQEKLVTLDDLKGKVQIVHIFASWCSVCLDEHAMWMEISKKWPYNIVGIVYR